MKNTLSHTLTPEMYQDRGNATQFMVGFTKTSHRVVSFGDLEL